MVRRIRYTKPTIRTSITAIIIGAVINAIYIFIKVSDFGTDSIIALAGLIVGLLGLWLTNSKRKSAAFCLVIASWLPAWQKFSGVDSILPCVCGVCYVFASMNDFQLINLGTPMLESSNDVLADMLDGKMISDAAGKQDIWLKAVHDFISRYTVFAYYGYIFAAVASLFLHLAWALAPEIWQGYSREFWALLGAGGLTALAGFITEIGRRKFTE